MSLRGDACWSNGRLQTSIDAGQGRPVVACASNFQAGMTAETSTFRPPSTAERLRRLGAMSQRSSCSPLCSLVPSMTGQFWCSVGSAIRPMAGLGHEPALLPMGTNGCCRSKAERRFWSVRQREADTHSVCNFDWLAAPRRAGSPGRARSERRSARTSSVA
jgi:hypothetical protein